MNTRTLSVGCMTLLLLVVAADGSLAQSTTAAVSVKRLAKDSLSCSDPNVSTERIGPAKRGYVATCGDTEVAIFEKIGSDFNKLLQSSMPMRAQWSFGRKANKGYFNFGWVVMLNSGGVCEETYRWNGNAYAKIQDRCD